MVVDDCGLVTFLGEFHLLHAIISVGERAFGVNGERIGHDGFVVQMKVSQGKARLAEGPEIDGFLHRRNAR
ncbi:hypothetical protein D3C78_1798350 [compost metagenome]